VKRRARAETDPPDGIPNRKPRLNSVARNRPAATPVVIPCPQSAAEDSPKAGQLQGEGRSP